jgi:hypothetical protein
MRGRRTQHLTGGDEVSTKTTGILALFLMLTLIACDGGGGSSVLAGGIGGTGKSAGSISAFGSVFVNGTEFETDNNTAITINGQSKAEADLQVGFFVLVESDIGDTVANSIDFSESVRGTVEDDPVIRNPATLSATMTVLGQTVVTNSLTSFDGLVLAQNPQAPNEIKQDDVVVVSGTRNADGAIVASYVGPPSSVGLSDNTADLQVEGPASNVTIGVAGKTLQIGGLSVDFIGAELPHGNPVDGQLTKAEGTLDPNGVLIATKVETDIDLVPEPGDELELEGFITEFTSIADFKVGGQRVTASSATIEDGPLPADPINTPVEVEGPIDVDGVLQAERLEVKPAGDDNDIRIDADVDSVDVTNSSVTLLGVQMQVTVSSRLEDKSSAQARPFTLSDIHPGDRLQTRGFQGTSNNVTASLIEREDPDNRVILQGPGTLNRPNNTIVTILRIPVPTTGGTTFMRNDTAITRQAFVDGISDGVTVVKSRWDDLATIDPLNPPAPDELSIEEVN